MAIGNLLGYQTKSLFPTTTGRNYEKTTLLEPLWDIRDKMTVLRGLDHGVKGGHFAVHSFLSGVLHSEAQNRPDGNVTIDQFLADEVGFETRFPSLTVGSEGGIHGGCQIAWTKSGVRVPPVTNPAGDAQAAVSKRPAYRPVSGGAAQRCQRIVSGARAVARAVRQPCFNSKLQITLIPSASL